MAPLLTELVHYHLIASWPSEYEDLDRTNNDCDSMALSGDKRYIFVLSTAVSLFLSLCFPLQLFEHWQALRKQLEPDRLSSATAPRSFLALIQSIRKASKDEILKVLKDASKSSL